MAFNFSMEKFEGDKLKYKLLANRIKWNEKNKNYTLYNYSKRKVGKLEDGFLTILYLSISWLPCQLCKT